MRTDPLDPQRLAAWRAFLTAHRHLVDRLTAELDESQGLALAWYDVLVNLHEAPSRRLRMTDLAARVLLSRSGLTRLVDRMAAAGLVDRQQCPTDRRGTFVVLSAAGVARLQHAAPDHLAAVAAHFGDALDDSEAATLATALQRVTDRLSVRT
jgi:DNA-binding MarR family transcriptional regulator